MNQIDLQNRIAIVTGGARGIGYAIAKRMLRSGAAVVLWDIDAARLEEARARLSEFGMVDINTVELTDETSVANAAGTVLERH
jgi:3-oxoacyl-[acyl-carrier protein] reductase